MGNSSAVKQFSGLTIKDADKGEIEAIVATLGVVDKDGDIIRRGALSKRAAVTLSSWGHDAIYGVRPAGKGTLVEKGNTLTFSGRVFLSTTSGRETFEVLKEMGDDQEWSFGFRVTGWEAPTEDEKKAGAWRIITKMEAFEVSPVLIGAGINTQTTSTKAADPEVDAELAAIAKTVTQEVLERRAAEAKAAEELAAAEAKAADDAARAATEAAAAAEAQAAAERKAAETDALTREFETFQRTMRRVS